MNTVIYVSNHESREISILAMSRRSGKLSQAQRMAVAGMPGSLAVSPDKCFLYASLRPDPNAIASFAVDRISGCLRHLSTVPVPDPLSYIVTDRAGRFLLGASYHGAKLVSMAIGPDGAVRQEMTQIVPTPPKAHAIVTNASNRYAYATSIDGDVIMQYVFDVSTGRLSPNSPPGVYSMKGAGPRHLAFHPSGQLLYCMNELDAGIDIYRVDAATGRLGLLQSLSALPEGFKGTPWGADIHVTPDGRFLYVSERGTNTIAGFSINSGSGKLAKIGHFPTEQHPRSFAIDPRGCFLLAAGQMSHRMSVSAIDQVTGQLNVLESYSTGQGPIWIEVVDLD